ncbi:MAG: TRAP transporter substrate-binding protein [Firmicutes bacterium]|nr:TRAP transporter substrate-binding protein [Bacillota bacterium]
MKKNILFSVLSVIVVVSVIMGYGVNGSQASARSVKLIAAHVNTVDSSYQAGMEAFKEKLEEISNGNIKVEIHPNGELGGNEDELVQKMATGTVDVIVASPGFLAAVVPEIDLLSIPYLYEDSEHWEKVVSGEVGNSLASKVENDLAFHALGYWKCGTRQYFGTKPVSEVADLKGVKIRVHNSQTVQSVWAALGAQPTSLAYNELYSGLQNNVIDAAENDLGNILLQKFYEAGPYISLTNHDIATRFFLMIASKYNMLNDEQKAWVDEASEYACKKQWAFDDALQEEAKAEIKAAGGVFNEVNLKEFAEVTYDVRLKAAKEIGALEEFNKIAGLKNN